MRTAIGGSAGRRRGFIPFHWAYFAAHLGLFFGYIPFFGLYLPVRVAALSDFALRDQSAVVLVGSIAASMAGVASGRLCDAWFRRTGQRRPIVWAGLTVIIASYVLFAQSGSIAALMGAIIMLQMGINLTLSGLTALFAVHVAAADKARLASMVNLCLPIANLGILLALWDTGGGSGGGGETVGMAWQLAVLCAVMAVLFLPLLLWRGGATASLFRKKTSRAAHPTYAAVPDTATYLGVFAARLLVQFSGSLLLTFAQPYLVARFPSWSAGQVQDVFVIMVVAAALLAVPIALTATWAAASRINPLTVNTAAAAMLAAAMALLAWGGGPAVIIAGYAVFMSALITYLAIDTAVVAQWLAASPTLATRLGWMNLANTLPGIALPLILLAYGAGAHAVLPMLFLLTAAGAGMAAGVLIWARQRLVD